MGLTQCCLFQQALLDFPETQLAAPLLFIPSFLRCISICTLLKCGAMPPFYRVITRRRKGEKKDNSHSVDECKCQVPPWRTGRETCNLSRAPFLQSSLPPSSSATSLFSGISIPLSLFYLFFLFCLIPSISPFLLTSFSLLRMFMFSLFLR